MHDCPWKKKPRKVLRLLLKTQPSEGWQGQKSDVSGGQYLLCKLSPVHWMQNQFQSRRHRGLLINNLLSMNRTLGWVNWKLKVLLRLRYILPQSWSLIYCLNLLLSTNRPRRRKGVNGDSKVHVTPHASHRERIDQSHYRVCIDQATSGGYYTDASIARNGIIASSQLTYDYTPERGKCKAYSLYRWLGYNRTDLNFDCRILNHHTNKCRALSCIWLGPIHIIFRWSFRMF